MGFLDKLKGMFGRSKNKATEVASDAAETNKGDAAKKS